MKRMLKILPILMIVLMVLMTAVPVYASQGEEKSKTASVLEGISPDTDNLDADTFRGFGNKILGIIQVFGSIIAVGVLMVLGIKYMMGSAEEKAEYKKTMLPYLIGAIILFAAVNIANAVISMILEI